MSIDFSLHNLGAFFVIVFKLEKDYFCDIYFLSFFCMPDSPYFAANSKVTGVTSSASSAMALSRNDSRKGYKIKNASTQVLYVNEGGPASIASGGYSYDIQPGQIYEPVLCVPAVEFYFIWAAANGYANVTEYF